MILAEILQNIVLLQTTGTTEIEVSGIQFDSRKVEKGCVFVATKGTASDGHQYISIS